MNRNIKNSFKPKNRLIKEKNNKVKQIKEYVNETEMDIIVSAQDNFPISFSKPIKLRHLVEYYQKIYNYESVKSIENELDEQR